MSLILLGILNSQVAGGAAPAYEHIYTTTTSSSSITLSSLPQDYKHLQLRMLLKCSNTGSQGVTVRMKINGDSSAVYDSQFLQSSYNSITSENYVNASTGIQWPFSIPANDATVTSRFAPVILDLLDYTNTQKYTVVRSHSGFVSSSNYVRTALSGGTWKNTSAVNSLTFTIEINNFTGARFALYGVRG